MFSIAPSGKDRKEYLAHLTSVAHKVFLRPEVCIVISTCSNAYHPLLAVYKPKLVVVDEAGFAPEATTLCPLPMHRDEVAVLLLAGDDQQPPPVTLSKGKNEYSAQQRTSLFARVQAAQLRLPFNMLRTNYRMAPEIADMVGVLTYGGLYCAPNTRVVGQCYEAWDKFFSTYAGLEIHRRAPEDSSRTGKQSSRRLLLNLGSSWWGPGQGSRSSVNFANVNCIVNLLIAMRRYSRVQAKDILVIVPYLAQKRELLFQIRLRVGQDYWPEVKTIDASPGSEVPFVIFDLTPANDTSPGFLGFLSTWNRMNVALSRAKEVLVVVCNYDLCMTGFDTIWGQSKEWTYWLQDLEDKGDVVNLKDDGDWKADHWLAYDKDGQDRRESSQSKPSSVKWAKNSGTRNAVEAAKAELTKLPATAAAALVEDVPMTGTTEANSGTAEAESGTLEGGLMEAESGTAEKSTLESGAMDTESVTAEDGPEIDLTLDLREKGLYKDDEK